MEKEKRDEINERVAASLRGHRARRKLNQTDVADGIGANTSTVSAWENRGGLSIADVWGLADAYGISIDELVGHEVPGPKTAA